MPTLDDLRSKQFVSGVPDTDDLIPYFDVAEYGNAPVKKTTVANLLNATDDATSADGFGRVLKTNDAGVVSVASVVAAGSLRAGIEAIDSGTLFLTNSTGEEVTISNTRNASNTRLAVPSLGDTDAILASVLIKTTTGDPSVGDSGALCINTFDNTFKVYAEGAWRQIITW